MKELLSRELYSNASASIALPYVLEYEYPWLCLGNIEKIILEIGKSLGDEYDRIGEGIWVSREAQVAKSAEIVGPVIIDKGAQVRHCAFIRGCAIIGKGAVVGNSTEIKNAILFDRAQAPHYNYIGDSVLGYASHMGAGSITSNLKGDKTDVKIRCKGEIINTGRRKIGAFVGDFAEIGCGTVLNPGTVVGRGAQIYPLNSVRGYVEKNTIYKGESRACVRRDICAE